MNNSKTIKSLCIAVAAVSCFSAYADDYNMVMKGRVGYIDTKAKIKRGADATASTHKFKDGYLGEVAVGYFLNKNLGLELSVGAGTFNFKNNSNQTKNLLFIPVTAMAQFYLPMNNTVRPYIGAGYSYKFIGNTQTNTKIKNAGSPAFQAGSDLFLSDSFGVNLDLKYTLKSNHRIAESNTTFKNDLSIVTATVGVAIPF